MASFPSGLASFAGFTSSHTLAADNHAAQHNLEQGEILAAQTKIGTGSSTPTNNKVLRGNGTGTSIWAQVALTTDVTGILPVANGGTGQATLTALPLASPAISGTVSGGATFTTPTLTTPFITDFTNATHTHQNNAGGGKLDASNAINAGSVSFANLLATIFSGQVQTQVNTGSAGGTLYWVNLGGIKLMWGISTACATNVAPVSYEFILPSFFSTIQIEMGSISSQSSVANQIIAGNTTSLLSSNWYLTSAGGAAASVFSIFLVGT